MTGLKAISSGEIYNIIEYEDCYRTDDLYYPKAEVDAVLDELDGINASIRDKLSGSAARLAASYEWHILDWLYHHKARRIYIVEWTTEARTDHSITLNRNCKYFEYFERGDAFRFARELRNDGIQALVKILDFKWLLELSDDQFEFLPHTNQHNKGLARKYRAVMKETYDNNRHTKADGPVI